MKSILDKYIEECHERITKRSSVHRCWSNKTKDGVKFTYTVFSGNIKCPEIDYKETFIPYALLERLRLNNTYPTDFL